MVVRAVIKREEAGVRVCVLCDGELVALLLGEKVNVEPYEKGCEISVYVKPSAQMVWVDDVEWAEPDVWRAGRV